MIPELKEFERGLYGLVVGIQCKTEAMSSSFHRKRNSEIQEIRDEERVIVRADKSNTVVATIAIVAVFT